MNIDEWVNNCKMAKIGTDVYHDAMVGTIANKKKVERSNSRLCVEEPRTAHFIEWLHFCMAYYTCRLLY